MGELEPYKDYIVTGDESKLDAAKRTVENSGEDGNIAANGNAEMEGNGGAGNGAGTSRGVKEDPGEANNGAEPMVT